MSAALLISRYNKQPARLAPRSRGEPTPGTQAAPSVCLAIASIFDSELTWMYAVLLALLLAGGIVIYAAYHWYRTLKQPEAPNSDDLAQLARALQEQGVLNAEEAEKIRAATERGSTATDPSAGAKKP